MYLITEIADREHVSVHAVRDRANAVQKANDLLQEHCRLGGHETEFEAAGKPGLPETWPEETKLAGGEDHQDPSGAWCNLKTGCIEHWDAHITSIDKPSRKTMLDILLKELCRDAMAAPGSSCGDGACEDCCVTSCLALMDDTWTDGSDKEKEAE